MPTITGAMDARRRVTRQSLQKTLSVISRLGSRKSPTRLGPKKISVAGLPVTGSDLFGREEDIAFLDDVWANQRINVVTIVAWTGVGKSTLVNHWLRRMAAKHYRSAELIFGWSFYRQGSSGVADRSEEQKHVYKGLGRNPAPALRVQREGVKSIRVYGSRLHCGHGAVLSRMEKSRGETNCSRIWTVLSGRSTVADRPAMKLPNRAMPAMIAGGKMFFGASPRALASRLSYWRRPPFGTTREPFRNSGRHLCTTRTARQSCT